VPRAVCLILALLLIGILPAVQSADTPGLTYVWESAGIALLMPPGWFALDAVPDPAGGTHRLLLVSGDAALHLTVYARPRRALDERPLENGRWSAVTADVRGRPRLDAALAQAQQLALRYTITELAGRPALAVESISANGTRAGRGIAGLLIDDRAITIMVDAPVDRIAAVSADRDRVIASLTLPPGAPPVDRVYGLVWASAPGTAADWTGVALDAQHVYGLVADGVVVLDARTGADITRLSFDAPAQATGIGAVNGIAFVGDRACRCIRRLDTRTGRWLDPIGVFGGGAPRALVSSADGVIYAIDGDERGWLLRTFMVGADGLSEREGTRTLVNSEYAADAPFALPSSDGDAHRLIAAHQRDRVSVDERGQVRLWSMRAAPIRYGASVLVDGVPVSGRLSALYPRQRWAFDGRAGERACLHATDPARLMVYGAGLDMALRITAPDGTLIGENDDHASLGLFGAYDAALCPVRLPLDGRYTVEVTHISGDGLYALALRRDRALEAGQVVQARGTILDTIPVERWTYLAEAGQTLTLSMIARDGDLDPLLFVYAPDGSFLVSNDDALDPTLGVNAQIVQTTLPDDGEYLIAAGRWSGTGAYDLVIVSTAP
jgi:hypothetical protein